MPRRLALLLLLLLLAPGCVVGKLLAPSSGGIDFRGNWPSKAAAQRLRRKDIPVDAVKLVVTLSGEGMTQPASKQAVQTTPPQTSFDILFDSVPPGDKQVDVAAFNANGLKVTSGQTHVLVVAGQVVDTTITLTGSGPVLSTSPTPSPTLAPATAAPAATPIPILSGAIRDVTLAGCVKGLQDSFGQSAQFSTPTSVAVDASGNVYVGEYDNNRLRKITATGFVSTFAGGGATGMSSNNFADGTGTSALFSAMQGLTIDSSGNLFVADTGNHRVRKVTPAGVVTTVAGSGIQGYQDGTGSNAKFSSPAGVAVDAAGNIYVADWGNNRLRKIDPNGVVTTIAGNGPSTPPRTTGGTADGTGTAASFDNIWGVVVAPDNNIYVSSNSTIRKVTPAGVVTTFAGSGVQGTADGTGAAAQFTFGRLLTADSSGNIFVADGNANNIRVVSPAGVVTTLFTGSASQAVALDSSGNLYFADLAHNSIRRLQPQSAAVPFAGVCGTVTTLAGSSGNAGFADGTGTAALFHFPSGITADTSGNLYVADSTNERIRKVTPAGVVTTIAGNGTGGTGSADGAGFTASFNNPYSLATDSNGNIFVSDYGNSLIRKVTPAGVVTSLPTGANLVTPVGLVPDASGNIFVVEDSANNLVKVTPAGAVTTVVSAAASGFFGPHGMVRDSAGNFYVVDLANSRIAKVTPAGAVTTLAGSSSSGTGSADGSGTAATFNRPDGLAMDTAGNLYVCDYSNHMIRMVSPTGVVTTLAGNGAAGFADGTGTAAQFNSPNAITIGPDGSLYVTDQHNQIIRKIQ